MTKVGERIGAILSATVDGVKFLGYGVYAGEEVPTEAAGMMGELLREAGVVNPKLVLDNGDVVYGCECWWGSEARVRKELEGRRVIEASISEERKVVTR